MKIKYVLLQRKDIVHFTDKYTESGKTISRFMSATLTSDWATDLLTHHGVRPTSGRILVARALAEAGRPLTMSELEDRLVTVDKSGIFRALTLFREHHVVHAINSDEGARYELCHADAEGTDDDRHVHFNCKECHRTLCMEETPVPAVELPEGFVAETANLVVEGICAECAKRKNKG